MSRLPDEPARLAILTLLAVVETAYFTFIMQRVGLTGGNLGAHIAKLQERGFVEVRKEFVEKLPRTLVSLTESGRTALLEYRRTFQRVLETISGGSNNP
ncbi:MAG: transcriptional regulator [Acidobacteria bacterium]|nr:transcriptional regulator [Acidobacteriota bacterium]